MFSFKEVSVVCQMCIVYGTQRHNRTVFSEFWRLLIVAAGVVVVLGLPLHVAGACSPAQATTRLRLCNVECCGTPSCTCTSLCPIVYPFNATSLSGCGKALDNFNEKCTHSQCSIAAVEVEECATDPAFADMYLSNKETKQSCRQLTDEKNCSTFKQFEDADRCIARLSCLDNATVACTSSCYSSIVECYSLSGCQIDGTSAPDCRIKVFDRVRHLCYNERAPCWGAGGSAQCMLNHYKTCEAVAIENAATATAPPLAPTEGNSSGNTALIVVVALLSVLLVCAVAVAAFGFMKLKQKADGEEQEAERREDDPLQQEGVVQSLEVPGLFVQMSSAMLGQLTSKEENAYRQSSDARARSVRAMLKAGMWQRGKLVGKGSSGSVFTCILGDGSFVAMKQIDAQSTNTEEAEALSEELRMMSQLRDRYIIRYYHAQYDSENHNINLWMEYIHGGSLASLVKKLEQPLSEQIVKNYVRQIVCGLKYLHANNVVHRDIKADNILIEGDGTVKLADFGSAKRLTGHKIGSAVGSPLATAGSQLTPKPHTSNSAIASKYNTHTIVGTPLWMAPEVVNPESQYSAEAGYNFKADIWSLGITVAELLDQGRTPWPEFTSAWAALFHIGNLMDMPQLPKCSSLAEDFMLKCLQPAPSARPSAEELLHHPWLENRESIVESSMWDESASFDIAQSLERGKASQSPLPESPMMMMAARERAPLPHIVTASSSPGTAAVEIPTPVAAEAAQQPGQPMNR